MPAIASSHDSCAEPFRQARGNHCSNLERAYSASPGNRTRTRPEALYVQSLAAAAVVVVVVVAGVAEVVDMTTASASSHTD
jgi:hypothetical protein